MPGIPEDTAGWTPPFFEARFLFESWLGCWGFILSRVVAGSCLLAIAVWAKVVSEDGAATRMARPTRQYFFLNIIPS
jgi:hypothetical protein